MILTDQPTTPAHHKAHAQTRALFPTIAIMPRFLWLTLLTFFLFQTACITVGPDYSPPVHDAPRAWNNLDTSVVHPGQSDLSRWWQALETPLLTELIDEALRNNLDIRSAEARLQETRARRASAFAGLFPTLGASASSRASRSGSLNKESYATSLDASWELDFFGAVRRSVEAADANLEASAAQLKSVQVALAAETATNYVTVRTLQERLRIAHANLASQAETLQLTQWRVQAGLTDALDVVLAQANVEETRARIPALETSLAEARHNLDILLAREPGSLRTLLERPEALPALPEALAVGIPAETLRQRPDIRVAERALAAATAQVGVAEAARYPSFTLSGSLGLEALSLSSLSHSGAETSSLLAGITAPLFQAGRLKAQAEAQDALREQALIAYEQAVLTALQDVENALVALAGAKKRAQALNTAEQAAAQAALWARQRYLAGIIDFQTVLDTERSLLSAQDSLASARAETILALVRLYKGLGGGWDAQRSPNAKE